MLEKTTYKVFNAPIGKTTVFNNLYFINKEFVFNGSASDTEISAYPNVHYHHTNFEMWAPKIFELPNEQDDIQLITTPHFYTKETLHYHPAHTLMDDIFSIFYSLYKCKINYNPLVCLLDMGNDKIEESYDCKGMFSLLFGHPAVPLNFFKNTNSRICFKTFIVGTGGIGFSSYDSNFVSPFRDEIWKKFRDAFYGRAEISLEIGNKIIYANTTKKTDNLEEDLKDTLIKHDIEIVCWGEVPHIKEQLNILKNVQVYITTDGSVSLNSIFLPDNAKVINLGRTYVNDDYKAVGYSEDYLFPALSYVDVFYFEDYYHSTINECGPAPDPDDLVQMIEGVIGQPPHPLLMRRTDIYEDFASKVVDKVHQEIKLNNFSPNARLLMENYPNDEERADVIKSLKPKILPLFVMKKFARSEHPRLNDVGSMYILTSYNTAV